MPGLPGWTVTVGGTGAAYTATLTSPPEDEPATSGRFDGRQFDHWKEYMAFQRSFYVADDIWRFV